MKKHTILSALCLVLTLSAALLCAGCGQTAEPQEAQETPEALEAQEAPEIRESQEPQAPQEPGDPGKIIEEMVVDYGSYGEEADARIAELLQELQTLDADAAARWERIMALWKTVDSLPVNEDLLPDGLPDTDELCIVALGFQLEPDGSMREELIQRLTVVLNCAEKYPNALIVCTGGGTASLDPGATEAGKMAEWLIENGVAPERVIVEDQSLTTAQNAIYTYAILTERYPQVRQLAIVSSDYHIATGTLLFEAEAILRAKDAEEPLLRVVSNAAWAAPSGSLSAMFQAGALIELSGNEDTAFDIYYETYDIHELPPLP
jgi:hypothetical protein